MSYIQLTVRQIINLGLWNKVCEYKGWNEWILNEGRIDENEMVEFDDEFKKETKWEIEYTDCTDKLTQLSSEAYEMAEGNTELQNKISSLGNHAVTSLKYEIIVRELEEYLESVEHRKDFDELRDILGRGLNLDFPDDY